MSSDFRQVVFRSDQLDAERAAVLVIDLQEKLLPLINHWDRICHSAVKLIDGAKLFRVPVFATEQYPKGIGPTVDPVQDALIRCDGTVLEKTAFSIWAETRVREALIQLDRQQIVIAGIETHVCVQQAALDLRSRDYDVYVCADAIGSRTDVDHKTALARMRMAGVFVTTVESVLFELCRRCDAPPFKAMLELIKAMDSQPPF